MSVDLLLRGLPDQYFTASRDAPSDFWFFLHIPKTAGSSFRAELASRLRPDANIFVTYEDPHASHEERLHQAVSVFLASAGKIPPRFASGHLYRAHVELLRAAYPHIKLITMLRHPVARVISDYRYQRTPAHPPHREFIEAFPDLGCYVRCRPEQNKMHHYLSRYPGQPVDEVVREIEREFVFVGTQEQYEYSCRVLFALLGRLEYPVIYDRKTQDTDENRLESIDYSAEIEATNSLDMQLYRYFSDRLAAVQNATEQALPSLVNAR